jgi:hypothetical protein
MKKCTWSVPSAKGSMLLLGDSNAGQFAEPALALAQQRGWDFSLATFGGCPFAPVSSIYVADPHDIAGCDRFVAQWTADVVEARPTVVVLANASSAYIEDSGITMAPAGSVGSTATGNAAKAELWRDALRDVLRRWVDSGVSVVIVNTVPRFPTFDLKRCPAFKAYHHAAQCAEVLPSQQLSDFSQKSRQAEKQAALGIAHTSVLDLTPVICPQRACSTFQEGRFAYRDGFHLSVDRAMSLQPLLDAAVERALSGTLPAKTGE